MSKNSYDYKCEACDITETHLVSYERRHKVKIECVCGGPMRWQFPVDAIMGFQPYETHYNEALGCDVGSRRELKRILQDKGLQEAGDPVHGSRNFDKHAPFHVKPTPPKGIPYAKKTEGNSGWMVNTIDRKGKTTQVSTEALKKL